VEFEKDIDRVNFSVMFTYLESKGIDTTPICRQFNLDRDRITKRGSLCEWKEGAQIMQAVKKILNQPDPRIFFEIGKESVNLKAFPIFLRMGQKIGNIERNVRFIPRFNKWFNDIFEMEIYEVQSGNAVLVVKYKDKPGYDSTWLLDQDFWNEGIVAAIPTAWGKDPITTVQVTTRFPFERIMEAYSFQHINWFKSGHRYFIDDEEIAVDCLMELDELNRSGDILQSNRILGTDLVASSTIFKKFENSSAEERSRYPKGTVFLSDYEVSELWTIPKGFVAGADMSMYFLSWKDELSIFEKVFDLLRWKKQNRALIEDLTKELEESRSKEYKIQKLLNELTEYKDFLEEKVESRTRELKTAQAQLLNAEKLASIGQLAAGIAHEINNPAVSFNRGVVQLKEVIEYFRTSFGTLKDRTLSNPDLLKLSKTVYETGSSANKLTSREVRVRSKELAPILEKCGVQNVAGVAKDLIRMNLDASIIQRLESFEDLSQTLKLLKNIAALGSLISTMEISSTRIIHITESLKRYAHLDQSPEGDVNVSDSIEDTLMILHNQLRYGIEVIRDYDEVSTIEGFPAELGQVWTNIILNATQAMNGKGTLLIRIRETEKHVLVAIQDSGPGIAPEIKDRIFDPFFSTKDQSQGTGLGLDIVYKIVTEKHNGSISVDSEPGKTEFEIHLPKRITRS
jgi:signal transduction histidine kinase